MVARASTIIRAPSSEVAQILGRVGGVGPVARRLLERIGERCVWVPPVEGPHPRERSLPADELTDPSTLDDLGADVVVAADGTPPPSGHAFT